MIFQEPMTSLNPVYTIGDQIIEAITLHQGESGRAAVARAVEMLDAARHPRAANAGCAATRTRSPAACASAS